SFLLSTAKSQPKRSCRGHCSRTCGKGEREEHTEDCGRMHCCLTHRKKK
ncbi:hypothetical protein Nmel_004960, partial [Mimus melanotis]